MLAKLSGQGKFFFAGSYRLEIPCVLHFEGDKKVTAKAKKLVESALSATTVDLLASKKRKVVDISTILPDSTEDSSSEMTKTEWVRFGKDLVFTFADKECTLARKKLDDSHTNLAQNMLKQQFSEVEGL